MNGSIEGIIDPLLEYLELSEIYLLRTFSKNFYEILSNSAVLKRKEKLLENIRIDKIDLIRVHTENGIKTIATYNGGYFDVIIRKTKFENRNRLLELELTDEQNRLLRRIKDKLQQKYKNLKLVYKMFRYDGEKEIADEEYIADITIRFDEVISRELYLSAINLEI